MLQLGRIMWFGLGGRIGRITLEIDTNLSFFSFKDFVVVVICFIFLSVWIVNIHLSTSVYVFTHRYTSPHRVKL